MTLPDLRGLTLGQRRIIATLLSPRLETPTYKRVADKLNLSLSTVYEQLRRVREHHPDLYQQIMLIRKAQLAKRHKKALKRAEAHSKQYFRRRYNREYKEKYGFYPWERHYLARNNS